MTEAAGWFDVAKSDVTHVGVLTTLRVDEVRMPDGSTSPREVAEHADAVAVVPVMPDETVLLLRQYRHAVGQYLLEIPAGMLDVTGEAESEAAQRELIEEVGHQAGTLRRLTQFHNSAGWTDEHTTVYLGLDLERQEPPDDFEREHEEADMEVVRVPLHAAVELITSGGITDAKTIIGLLLAQHALRGA